MTGEVRDHLGGLRWKLDILDTMIADLLERRLRLSLEIQSFKAEKGLPQEDPRREKEIRERMLIQEGRPVAVWVMLREVIRIGKEEFRRLRSDTGRPGPGRSTPP